MAVKGGSELVKYMTEQFVTYMETPAEARKQNKHQRQPEALMPIWNPLNAAF